MNILIYFLLGGIFLQYLLPLFDSCLSLLLTEIEVLKGKANLKISEYSVKIQNLAEDNTSATIGFDIGQDYEGETYE